MDNTSKLVLSIDIMKLTCERLVQDQPPTPFKKDPNNN